MAMDDPRLPPRIEVSGWIRRAEARGGGGMVLHRGDPDAGTILLVSLENNGTMDPPALLWERLPQPDGQRVWTVTRAQDPESKHEFNDYIAQRTGRDPDLWVVELTVANPQQFVGNPGTSG